MVWFTNYVFLVNFFAKISDCIPINYDTVAFCVQWIYDIVFTVEVVAILIKNSIIKINIACH